MFLYYYDLMLVYFIPNLDGLFVDIQERLKKYLFLRCVVIPCITWLYYHICSTIIRVKRLQTTKKNL